MGCGSVAAPAPLAGPDCCSPAHRRRVGHHGQSLVFKECSCAGHVEGAPWCDLVVHILQIEVLVPLAPFVCGHGCQAHPFGNGRVEFAGSANQHNRSPRHDRKGQRPWGGDALGLLNLVFAENQRRPSRPIHGTNTFKTSLILVLFLEQNISDQKRVGLPGLDKHCLLPSFGSGCYLALSGLMAREAVLIP